MQNEKSVEQIIGKRIQKIRQAKGIGFVLYPNQFEEFKNFIKKVKERPVCKQFITYEKQFKFDKGVKK